MRQRQECEHPRTRNRNGTNRVREQRPHLRQPVMVRESAALWAASGPRGVHQGCQVAEVRGVDTSAHLIVADAAALELEGRDR